MASGRVGGVYENWKHLIVCEKRDTKSAKCIMGNAMSKYIRFL